VASTWAHEWRRRSSSVAPTSPVSLPPCRHGPAVGLVTARVHQKRHHPTVGAVGEPADRSGAPRLRRPPVGPARGHRHQFPGALQTGTRRRCTRGGDARTGPRGRSRQRYQYRECCHRASPSSHTPNLIAIEGPYLGACALQSLAWDPLPMWPCAPAGALPPTSPSPRGPRASAGYEIVLRHRRAPIRCSLRPDGRQDRATAPRVRNTQSTPFNTARGERHGRPRDDANDNRFANGQCLSVRSSPGCDARESIATPGIDVYEIATGVNRVCPCLSRASPPCRLPAAVRRVGPAAAGRAAASAEGRRARSLDSASCLVAKLVGPWPHPASAPS